MLNHKQLRLVGVAALLVCLLLDVFLAIHWIIYLVLALVFLGIIAYGSANIQSQFFIKAICAGAKNKRQVALTFDDGPDPEITPQVLDILKAHQVSAAFFCIGSKIEQSPELLRRIHAEGHLIGNHSYSHAYLFDLYPYRKVLAELEQTNQSIAKCTGCSPRFFRPPYGVTNPAIAKAVKQTGQKVIGWNVRSLDTVIKNEGKLVDRIKRKLQPGSIILLHDTQKALPALLSGLLKYMEQQEYKVVRLDALIDKKEMEL